MIKTSPCNPPWISAGHPKPAGYCAAPPVDWERVSKTPSIVRDADQMKPPLLTRRHPIGFGSIMQPASILGSEPEGRDPPKRQRSPPNTIGRLAPAPLEGG